MYKVLVKRHDVDQSSGGFESVLPLDDLKKRLQVLHDEDDAMLRDMADAAIEYVEDQTRRTLPLSLYRFTSDAFSDEMEFRAPPVRGVTNVTYLDTNGARQTLPSSDYTIKTDRSFGLLRPVSTWPSGTDVEFLVVTGYGEFSLTGFPYTFPIVFEEAGSNLDIPRSIKQAAYLLTAHWYENREEAVVGTITSAIPHGVDRLLLHHKNYRF